MTPTPADPIRQEADLLADLQAQGLEVLRAELIALAALLPGAPHPPRSEAETEADFDNMPV